MNAYKPRIYQEGCLEALAKARNQGKNKALVVMASGLGKTLTGAFDVREYLKTTVNGRVLVLCHSAAILTQTKESFKVIFGDSFSYGMYNGQEKATHKTDFLFANLQSVNLHSDEFEPDEFCYIIVDEAHHSPAETYRKAIEHFSPQFLLGMTATPERMDDADLAEIFGETVFEYRLESAIKDGWLSDVEYRVKTDEIQNLDTILDSGKKFSLAQLNREVFAPKRDEEIVRIIREEISEKDNPTMVIFCQTIAHAEKFAELMGDAVVIHSGLSNDAITKRLEGFRSGSIKTVCAVDMLNEGIDVPRTDVIVFLRVTQSKIVFTQQLGRGLRRADGKDKVLVLDFVSTADRLDMLFQFEREFKSTVGRYPDRKTTKNREFFTLNIDAPVFRDRKVDIIALIERARSFHQEQIRVSDEEMIEMLKRLGNRLGHTPSEIEVNAEPGMPDASTYVNRFGSFTKANLIAGFTIKPVCKRFTDEQLLELLRECADRIGRIPTTDDLAMFNDMPSSATYVNRFGGLQDACEIAGLGRSRYDLSNEEMLDLYRKFAAELGRRPSSKEIQANPKLPSPGCYTNRFKSLRNVGDMLGLPRLKGTTSYSNEELIKMLTQFYEQIGHTPTMEEVSADPDMPSGMIYVTRFSSFRNALKAAGCPSVFAADDDTLLEMLRELGKKLGRTPSRRDVDSEPSMPSSAFYKKRFGSYSKAVLAAGYTATAKAGAHTNNKKRSKKASE